MAQRNIRFVLDLDSRGITRGTRKAKRGTDSYTRSARNAQTTTSRLGSTVKRFGSILATVFVADLGRRLFQNMITKGKEFEQQLADLSAITGISGADLEQLGDRALKTSSKFGESADNIVEAQKLVASQLAQSIDFGTEQGIQELGQIADQAVRLQKAAGVDLNTAVEVLTTSVNQFNLEASETPRIINAIAAGAKFGAAEAADQSEALREAGTVANSANISFEELNAAIQVLAANGIKGSRAGVALRNIITRLQTRTSELAEFGITDVNIKTQDMAEVFERLAPLLGNAEALTKIFGERAQAMASIFIRAASDLDSMNEKIHTQGVVTEQVRKQLNTFEGATNQLTETFNNKLIEAFQESNGAMVEMIRLTTSLVEEFAGGVGVINDFVIEMNKINNIRRGLDQGKPLIESILGVTFFGFGDELADAVGLIEKQGTQFLREQNAALVETKDNINLLESQVVQFRKEAENFDESSDMWLRYSERAAIARNEIELLEDRFAGQVAGLRAQRNAVKQGSDAWDFFNFMLQQAEQKLARVRRAMERTAQKSEQTGGGSGGGSNVTISRPQGGGAGFSVVGARETPLEEGNTLGRQRTEEIQQQKERLRITNEIRNSKLDIVDAEKSIADIAIPATKKGNEEMKALAGATNLVGDALVRAVVQGEKLGNILASVARQLASRAIMTGLQLLLTPASGFFGTFFGGGGGVVPQGADGGFLRGPRHSQGGIPALVGGGMPLELEGGEFVVNRRSTQQNLDLLEAVNSGGGGQSNIARQIEEAIISGMSKGNFTLPIEQVSSRLGDFEQLQKRIGNN